MAEKDKLSKEVEEQIQSLASDVYIQVEEKLTQLIGAIAPKELANETNIEQDPAYIELQNKYQTSQTESTEQTKNFLEKISQLEQETNKLTMQLEEGRDKQAVSDASLKAHSAESTAKLAQLSQENSQLTSTLAQENDKLSTEQQHLSQTIEKLEKELVVQKEQSQIAQTQSSELIQQLESQKTSNENELLAAQEEIANLQGSLATLSAQEQGVIDRLNSAEQEHNQNMITLQTSETRLAEANALQANSLTEQENHITALTTKLNTTVSELEHAQAQQKETQTAAEKQQKLVADQLVQLANIDDELKQRVKAEQNAKQSIEKLDKELSQLKQQQLADNSAADIQSKQQQQAQEELQRQINKLEKHNKELNDSLVTEQEDIKLYEKEVTSLKSQVTLAQEGHENILNRFNTNRDKQEKDNNQVRETIKYLRDENSEMITQHNIQKEGYIEQINELESKLTEYRLKFEYAQKQLTQSS